jgi:lipopolysaccharide export system protein LptC
MAFTSSSEPGFNNRDAPNGAPETSLGDDIAQRWRRATSVPDPSQGRSNRLVGMMKLLLPATAVALIGLIVAWPQLKTEGRFPLGPARINPNDAEVVRMVNARFHGTDEHGSPYAVTAVSATQPTGAPNVIQMEEPKADMTMQDGTWVALTAAAGVFHRDRHQVMLSGGVNVFHDQGYEFRSASAEVDLKGGTAVGNERVEGQGPFGQIQSEGFRILDRGHRLIFTGKARMTMLPGAGSPLTAQAGGSVPAVKKQ